MPARPPVGPVSGAPRRRPAHGWAPGAPWVVHAARDLPETIVQLVCTEVTALGWSGRARRVVREAVTAALAGFFDPGAAEAAAEHFHGIGAAGVRGGADIAAVLHALNVASIAVSDAIVSAARRESVSGTFVAGLMADVLRYLRRLATEVQRGFADVQRQRSSARVRLARGLASGRGDRPVAELAAEAGWRLPGEVVVLMTDLTAAAPDLATSAPPDILTHVDGRRLAATCSPGIARTARAVLLRQSAQAVVVQTWAVPVDRAADAHRWARRTLQLVRGGRIRPDAHRVVMCADHRFTLWATADDALAEEISREILAPLALLPAASRLNLAETLLLWLTCRESVPLVAARLGVHPNTVRRRVRLLRGLFGAALVDPQQCGDLVLALRRVLPVWQEARRR